MLLVSNWQASCLVTIPDAPYFTARACSPVCSEAVSTMILVLNLPALMRGSMAMTSVPGILRSSR